MDTFAATFDAIGAIGVAAVLAPGAPGLDGVMSLECKVGRGKPRVLRFCSQSKWSEAIVPDTGRASTNALMNSEALDYALWMRANIPKGRGPNDVVVLDVFSDRLPPKKPATGTQVAAHLEDHEVAIVARGERFDQVVGDSLAGRKRLRRE